MWHVYSLMGVVMGHMVAMEEIYTAHVWGWCTQVSTRGSTWWAVGVW